MRNYVGDPSKLAFILPELLFHLLELLDVSGCSVPPDDLARLVP
jgi:hypothetical protein